MFQKIIFYTGLLVLALLVMGLPLSAHAHGQSQVTLDQVNKAVAEIDKLAQEQIDSNATPGIAIAVVYDDKVVYEKGFGVREVGKPELVDENTVFQIASMSKAVASTVTAALVSDGVVTWDTEISDIDPSFQLHEAYPTSQVTVRDLFAHRSGLGGAVGNDLVALGYDRDTMLERLHLVEPGSSFRSTYSYSNAGITEGAVASAKPTGKTWEEVSDEKLYQPLGMTSTSSRYSDLVTRTNRASLHSRIDGEWASVVQFNDDAQSPAGGVSSSVKDLAQWLRLQLANGKYDGKQVISEEALAQTRRPNMYIGMNPVNGIPTFYGAGMAIEFAPNGPVRYGHAGAFTQGSRTTANFIPAEKLGIVVLTNGFPTGIPEGIAATFFDLVHTGQAERDWIKDWNDYYDRAYGAGSYTSLVEMYSTPPAVVNPALSNAAYLGTFNNDYFGDIQVIEKDGGLALQMGPQDLVFPLKHFDHDLFIYYPYPEMPDYPSSVTFTIGADQKASQVVIDDLNSNGQGILKRVTAAP